MSCAAESLYHLDFEVKTMTRCNRSNGTCATVAVQFLNHPEQTVCEIPGTADASTSGGGGGGSGTRKVGQGKKFTFAMPGGGGCGGCPKPVRVTVRVYHQDGNRSRVLLGSGELDVTPSRQRPAADHDDDDDEQTVVIKKPRDDSGCGGSGRCGTDSGRSEGDTVAVLAVRARAWCAGPVTAVPLEPAAGRERDQCRNKSTTMQPPPSCGPQKKLDDGCCSAAAKARRPPPPAARTTAGRQCSDCTAASITTDSATDTTADTTAADEHRDTERQYTSMDCEINGRKIDLHARYRDRETHEAEKQLVFEAEAFAGMVYTLVSEMHGLILKTNPPAPDIDG